MVDRVYFRDPTKEEEKEIIGLAEKRFRSSVSGSILVLILSLLFFLLSIGFFIFKTSEWGSGLGLLFLAVLFMIIGFVNKSSSKKVIKEFRQGHFLVQDIEVKDMLFQDPRCKDYYALALRTKEDDSFYLPVSSDIYKEFSIGMKGLLAVMYGEVGLFRSGCYYFIPEKDSVQLNEDAFTTSFDPDGESSELPSTTLSSLKKRIRVIPLLLAICEIPYLIGFIIALYTYKNAENPKAWFLPLFIASFIATFFLFFSHKGAVLLDNYLGKGKRSLFLFALLFCLLAGAMFVNAFWFFDTPKAVSLAAHIFWFIALGILTFVFSYKILLLSRGLKNGNVKWARGTIIHADRRFYAVSRGGARVPFITVRLDNGGIVFFDVYSEDKARGFKEGLTGYVIQIEDAFCGETVSHYFFEPDPKEDGSEKSGE